MSRALLITGATGKQGGSVIDALLSRRSPNFTILALTRDAQSASAERLSAKSPSIKLLEGNLNDVPALFASAKELAAPHPLWGVYSVQASMGKGVTLEDESSVERGGDARSWENPTSVPHFVTKHEIERHLHNSTADGKSDMGWTILRPSIFMDNLVPGFASKVFMTTVRDTLGDKPLQWVATSDIGVFAAMAFEQPEQWNKKAVGLAGDVLTFQQLSQKFEDVTGSPAGTTFGLLGKALKHRVSIVGTMVQWFKDEGYKADIPQIKKAYPEMMDLETWLRTKSAFVQRS
ncbi:NmrA-like family domain-containing protein [Botryosphaeria dothidea]|uniref:NmrA-like family domain-containing protein n=1 Tax=Botryosphaeria dothidea TaxID=55169 RepID=A0A8H4N6D5_9PEZI|nr:NmrA-like family domain-containing protein [Botryosphaeria dothidea]